MVLHISLHLFELALEGTLFVARNFDLIGKNQFLKEIVHQAVLKWQSREIWSVRGRVVQQPAGAVDCQW